MTKELSSVEALCPACGHCVSAPFFSGGEQPLATLAWPVTEEAALSLRRYPLDFVQCVSCTHVFNQHFNYGEVPYSAKPNLMYNKGRLWSTFVQALLTRLAKLLPANATVIEIGHGDGSFLRALAQQAPNCRFVGFDPHGERSSFGNVAFKGEYFAPARHIAEFSPGLIISRHVLEHLASPRSFLQQVSFAATASAHAIQCYFEVPCIDHVFRSKRTVDFYYEHSSQFSTKSFSRLLQACALSVEEIGHGYNEEVVYGFVTLGAPSEHISQAHAASAFKTAAQDSLVGIQHDLARLVASGRRVVVWGGTGKSAAFINRYGLDRHRFPVVVDSDAEKVGTFVPGTGQTIASPSSLLGTPVDVIIIPPQWRAGDIVQELTELGLNPGQILIEHLGKLIDFRGGGHPYDASSPTPSIEREDAR